MAIDKTPHVTEATILRSGVIISFDDGMSAIFSSELLYATLPEAELVSGSEDNEE
jgi:hypothetical protein